MDNSARVEENPPCFVDGNYQFQEFHTIGSDGGDNPSTDSSP